MLLGLAAVVLLSACADDPTGAGVNTPCSSNNDCADQVCHAGVCAAAEPKKVGQACGGAGDCESYNCTGGVCRAGKRTPGEQCIRDAECATRLCGAAGTCAGKGPDGGAPDAPRPDVSRPDAPPKDAPLPDKPIPDLPLPDKPIPDLPIPDKPLPDQPIPDLPTPDKLVPDLVQPDTFNPCGNGKLDPSELCDGTLLGGKTCKTQGFSGGTLKCSVACALDLKLCYKLTTVKAAAYPHPYSENPVVAAGGGVFLVVWASSLNHQYGPWDVYGMLVDRTTGKILGNGPFPIANGAVTESKPQVAFGGTNFLVVWSAGQYNDSIGATRVSTKGKVLDLKPYTLHKNTYNTKPNYPSVSADSKGFLVVWQQQISFSASRIRGRRVTEAPTGLKLGASFYISTSSATGRTSTAFGGANHLVVWEQGGDLWGRPVSTAGVPQGSVVVVSNSTGTQKYPNAAAGKGEVVVAWEDNDSGGREVFGARFGASGAKKPGSDFAVKDNTSKYHPGIADDGKHLMVVWDYYNSSTGRDVKAVRLDNTGSRVDPKDIPLYTGGSSQDLARVAYSGGAYLAVWRHQVPSKGWHVQGALMTFGK